MAFVPAFHASTYAFITSSTVAVSGRFTVLLIAPEMNGWTEPIILMWPMWPIERTPFAGLKAQSKTSRCSSLSSGAPSMVPCASMYVVIAVACVSL